MSGALLDGGMGQASPLPQHPPTNKHTLKISHKTPEKHLTPIYRMSEERILLSSRKSHPK